jgi:hypothetical protein
MVMQTKTLWRLATISVFALLGAFWAGPVAPASTFADGPVVPVSARSATGQVSQDAVATDRASSPRAPAATTAVVSPAPTLSADSSAAATPPPVVTAKPQASAPTATLSAVPVVIATDPPEPTRAPATPTTTPTQAPKPKPTRTAEPVDEEREPGDRPVASRIVIPSLDIDLAVISSDYRSPRQRTDYPLCDVAMYLSVFSQPGYTGTTYLYAHARSGMFLPLLTESEYRDGRRIIGDTVYVYRSDGRRYVYSIYRVKRHATNFTLATDLEPDEQRLVLQTSEGPRGTKPKLQVAARFVRSEDASVRASRPRAYPSVCG